jgi:hypothetical protein
MRDYAVGNRKANREGKQFEELLDRACFRHGINSVVFPLGGERRGKYFVQVKTPFDRILIRPEGEIAFVDAKSVGSGQTYNRSMLTEHQVQALYRYWEDGALSGYIVWFRQYDKIVFFNAELLWRVFTGGKSLYLSEGLQLGTLLTFDPSIIFNAHFRA